MCGRYALFASKEKLEETFGVTSSEMFEPNFNAAPGESMPVVFLQKARSKNIRALRWGLSAADEPVAEVPSELLLENPLYRRPFQRQRCIVPVSGFYEWQTLGKLKIPYYIRALDQELMGLAGIFEKSADDGETGLAFGIISSEANDLLNPLRNRMPVILRRRDFDAWLDPLYDDLPRLHGLLKPYPTERMALYRVGREVDDPSNKGPELVRPVI